MTAWELAVAGAVLVGTAALGVTAHELSHAIALRLAGVACKVEVLPDSEGGFGTGVAGPLARVRPVRLPDDIAPWQLRTAAMMPLCLAAPFGLVLVGLVPDPFAVGSASLEMATVAWLGCSIPSPQDFSLLWHPEGSLTAHREVTAVP